MAEAKPIVRLTRWSVASNDTGRGKRRRTEAVRWTIYGIDAEGIERVYVEHTTEAEHDAWRATDPLWAAAQRASFAKLLADPRTRDFVLRINIKAALDTGDTEMALALARHLSPETWAGSAKSADSEASPEEGTLPSREVAPPQGEARAMANTSTHGDFERDSESPMPKVRRRRKREEAKSPQSTPPSAEEIVSKVDLLAAREGLDESQGESIGGAMVSPHGHENVGEHIFTTFKEVRRALKAAETFGFNYVLTRSTEVQVAERDENGDISETEVYTMYSL